MRLSYSSLLLESKIIIVTFRYARIKDNPTACPGNSVVLLLLTAKID